MEGLIIDSFAGGGGASLGIEMALGRPIDIAINHDEEALSMHRANHPDTLHLSKNIWKVDPLDHIGGRTVDLAWFSPDCKHHSKAKGGKPVAKNIRDLAWVVVLWAERAKPNIIMLENVEEFRKWGPLNEDNKPCKIRQGQTFKKWIRAIKKQGYKVEYRELKASEYGAPTIRNRLYLIARRDGQPIVWPQKTHGKPTDPDVIAGRKLPELTSASCIDWDIPSYSIFLTKEEGKKVGVKRPLVENTMTRIAKGVFKYTVNHADPFIVTCNHGGSWQRGWDIHEPMKTITASRDAHGVVSPVFTYAQQGGSVRDPRDPLQTVTASKKDQNSVIFPHLQAYYGEGNGGKDRSADVKDPLKTVTTENRHALVAAFLAQHNTGVIGRAADAPLSTIMERGTQQQLVAAHMLNMKGSDQRSAAMDAPAPTVTAQGRHLYEVRAFLMKYYGQGGQWQDARDPMHTVPTKDRMGIVTVHGVDYQIVDIHMRMLTPRELFRAQGFPDSYIIANGHDGQPLTKTAQIRMCGNSVSPPVAQALVAANMPARMEAAA